MNKRKIGFYWIKRKNSAEWTIGYYQPSYPFGYWKIIGSEFEFTDFDLREINEFIIEFQEK